MTQTMRLGLPLLIPGQGQKDITHNEALFGLDMLVQPVVQGRARLSPPETISQGECWLVPAGADGDWAGKLDCIASWTSAGWRFVATEVGWSLWVVDESVAIRRKPGGWERIQEIALPGASVGLPAGGSVVDAQARSAIASVIHRLVGLGLIEA